MWPSCHSRMLPTPVNAALTPAALSSPSSPSHADKTLHLEHSALRPQTPEAQVSLQDEVSASPARPHLPNCSPRLCTFAPTPDQHMTRPTVTPSSHTWPVRCGFNCSPAHPLLPSQLWPPPRGLRTQSPPLRLLSPVAWGSQTPHRCQVQPAPPTLAAPHLALPPAGPNACPTCVGTLVAELTTISRPWHVLPSQPECSSPTSLPGNPSSYNLPSNVTPTYLGHDHRHRRPQTARILQAGCAGVRGALALTSQDTQGSSRAPSSADTPALQLPVARQGSQCLPLAARSPGLTDTPASTRGRGDKGRLTREPTINLGQHHAGWVVLHPAIYIFIKSPRKIRNIITSLSL